MPRYLTPADQTIIFTGFKPVLDRATIERFVRRQILSQISLEAHLEDQKAICVGYKKVFINFKSSQAASQALEEFTKQSAADICEDGQHLEVWIKTKGKSTAKKSYVRQDPSPQADPTQEIEREPQDHGDEFEVHLDPSAVAEIFGDKVGENFEEEFASWCPDEESTREFKPHDIQALLKKIESDDSVARIIGFNEFPYSAGKKLSGEQREIEREYWLHLKGVDKKLAGEDNLAILHVHYKGRWNPVPTKRDRTHITQINIRHTTKVRGKAFHMKCTDLNKWREKHGSSVIKEIPRDGWRWKEQSDVCRSVHKLLIKAEQCATKVRSMDLSDALQKNKWSDSGLRRALIIAVKKYDCEAIPNLLNAIIDGSKLESELQRLGWEVEYETNLPRREAFTAIDEFVDKVKGNEDACLFAFVGHGVEVNGKQYLVPRDAMIGSRQYQSHDDFEKDVKRDCIAFDDVRNQLGDVRDASEPCIFVLDCCRNDFYAPAAAPATRSIAPARPKSSGAVSSDLENSIVVFSTTSGSTAEDGRAGEGGPFMRTFVEEIGRDGCDLDGALMNTRRRVREISSSCQLAPSTSLLYGKFYFNPQSDDAAAGQTAGTVSRGGGGGGALQRIVHEEAREFWRQFFQEDEEAQWRSFREALRAEFPEVSEQALALVKSELDHNDDGMIHAREFNIYTKRDGLRSRIQEALAAVPHEAEPPVTPSSDGGSKPMAGFATDCPTPEPTPGEAPPRTSDAPPEVAAPLRADDPLLPLMMLGMAQIKYIGTGSVLGGQKIRQGRAWISGCWLMVVRERGDDKEPLHLGECSVLRSDKVDPGRGLEVIPSARGAKNLVFALATAELRESWMGALEACKRLLDEAAATNRPRFAELHGPVVAMAARQLYSQAPDPCRSQREVSHAVARSPLDAARPYFQLELLSGAQRGAVSLGLVSAATGRSPGHLGAKLEIGLHIDGHIYSGGAKVRTIRRWKVGERWGCGLLYDQAGRPSHFFFSVGDEVVAMIQLPAGGPAPPLYPAVALSDGVARVDLSLGLSLPDGARAFLQRCTLRRRDGSTVSFSSLPEAVRTAQAGETVELAAGSYFLEDSLDLRRPITLQAAKPGDEVLVSKAGGGFALQINFDPAAGELSLRGLRICCEGGDASCGVREPGAACAVSLQDGACRLQDCRVSCPRGTAVWIAKGRLATAGCRLGPCARHGLVLDRGARGALEATAVQDCGMIGLAVNNGATLEARGGEFRQCPTAVKAMGAQACPATETDLSFAGTAFVGKAPVGAAPAGGPQGQCFSVWRAKVSAVDCSVEGFEVAAQASGGGQASLRGCKLSRCRRAFVATEDATVVQVDCQLTAVDKEEEWSTGGRVVRA